MIYDLAIIGCGASSAFSVYKLAKNYPDIKAIIFESGRKPLKRRHQMQGFLGCAPNSDGKLYLSDLQKVASLIGLRKTKVYFEQFKKIIHNVEFFPTVKDKGPLKSTINNIKSHGFNLQLNDYIQMYPRNIHALSRYFVSVYENDKNLTFKFDTDANFISKNKNVFTIHTDNAQEYKAKKLIIAVGRSGWHWARDTFSKFGIITDNNTARFGIRMEMGIDFLRELSHSSCSLIRDDLIVGPFCWNGTIIPEDHFDLAISAFRSNEDRWHTDKVSFNVIGNREFENNGFEQMDRIGKLTFIVMNDRIVKEKVSNIISGKSKISIFPEYSWIKDTVIELSDIIPEIITKASYHIPTIVPMAPLINIGNNLSTEVDNMFVVGESANISGLLSAAITGLSVIDFVCK